MRFLAHLGLSAQNRAPFFVVGNRHPALDAHTDPGFWRPSSRAKQVFEQ
jgi:hypothetical protein